MTIDYNHLTREQAISIVGEDAVNRVENENCEPTSRKIDGEDPPVEFSATVKCEWEGEPARLTAIYFQSADEMNRAAEHYGDDLSSLDWEIDHYRLS